MPKEKKEKKERRVKKTEGETKSKSESEDTINVLYNLEAVAEIAQPLASKDLTKKLLKTVRKGLHVRRICISSIYRLDVHMNIHFIISLGL